VDAYVFDPKEIRPCDGCTACCTTIGVQEVWEHIPGALKWKSNRKIIDKLHRKYGLVIQGTKDTWGKIWIDDAPPPMKSFMDEMLKAGNNLFRHAARW
jgi:hypothetical protein